MAAMMHDVARPRAMALAAASGPAMPGMAGPSTLSEDQEDRLASGAAAVLTALGRVNEPSITRTVLTFEALWLRRKTWLGPVYWGARNPTLHASIIAIARRYNDLLTPEPGLAPPTPDYAVAMLANELTDPQDRSVLRMLVSALGLLPVGTIVQLQTGEVAEVVKGAQGLGDKPVVRLIADPNNQPYAQQMDVDVAQDPRRGVLRVLSVDGWKKGLAQQPQSDIEAEYDPDANNSAPPPAPHTQPVLESAPPPAQAAIAMPPPAASAHISPLQPVVSHDNHLPPPRAQYEQQYASWGEEEPQGERRDSASFESSERASSQSMPSMGSSPSAVAEAMGRMINDSLRPPNVTPAGADRTVFQPGGPDELAGRSTKRPNVGREPTARGNLAATPLPHVLVYMLDHSLTGSVVFEGAGNDDTIYFVHGVPAKVRLSEPIALLGDVLIDAGALEKPAVDQALDAAKRLNTLFGEYLVAHELVSRDMLSWALESQLLQKIAHLANLAPEIEYLYYRDVDLLPSWGTETSVTHPLNPILGSVRNWQDRARIRATLNRIAKHALVQHPDSDLNTLAMMPEEQVVLEAIRSEPVTLPQLFKRNLADEEIVSSLIYSLAVTRQFAFKGQKKGPMAARNAAWGRVNDAAKSSGSISIPATSSSQSTPSQQQPVSVSGSRPAPAAHTASAVAQNAPGPISSPISTTGPQMPAPPGPAPQIRRAVDRPAAQAAQAPQQVQRGPAPSGSMGAVPRANAPQIRPITAKKATVVGLQPAAPPEQRKGAPSGSMRQAAPAPGINVPAPAKGGAGPSAAPPSGLSRSGRPAPTDDDEDNAKTIAFVPGSNPLKDLLAKKGIPLPGAKLPAADPAVSKRPTVRKEAAEEDISFDDAGSIDFGDGMEDAEAALEAMQNFRLAEAALQRNDIANAEQLAQKAVDGDPTQADYVTLLAWVKALGNDAALVKSAVATMSKVLIEDPSNERALLYRGKLLVRTNRLHDALNDFNELLATNPHHREAASELRALKQKMGTP
jgi:hypothetical protein